MADLVVCMGDTLTHLPDRSVVETLVQDAASALGNEGVFIASFRDYASVELQGASRFIPVRSDARRILTAFLEYEGEIVRVHDLLYERIEPPSTPVRGVATYVERLRPAHGC